MPTYDYECEACGDAFETYQKISAEPLRLCTHCGKENLVRKVGGGRATLQFRGKGFYRTDYAYEEKDSSTGCCPCGKKQTCSDS
jgi:putative FmdB family regulatory protein